MDESRGLRCGFSHFWSNLRPRLDPTESLPAPQKMDPPENLPASEDISRWGWNPQNPDWAKGLRERWIPGEKAAHKTLDDFLDRKLINYATDRDRLDSLSFSTLSPYLHAGEITSKHIVRQTLLKLYSHPELQAGGEKFLSEIGWREFSRHLLIHFPQMIHTPFQNKFSRFPWKNNPVLIAAWKSGKTGYPVIDAIMRQLWETGFISNRARMITASFLSKDLLVDWKEGAGWFWNTLVDWDQANNTVSWQWVSGMGVDAAPYFRIYNPVLQGEKFDPNGLYVRHWVPEIRNLPHHLIHRPWEAPEDLLRKSGITLGENYPFPIIDHQKSRQEALFLFHALGKNKSEDGSLA